MTIVILLLAMFSLGTAFAVARLGAKIPDMAEILPFFTRVWMYASGVMFSIQTFSTLAHHPTLTRLLQYNPAAIYITLARNALLQSQRQSMPGARPYDRALCAQYYHPPPYTPQRFHSVALYHKFLAANMFNSAHCHAVVSQPSLWLFGAAWAVAVLIAGFLFFWRAEVQYGRG